MIAVGDLRAYFICPRNLWLKRVGIPIPNTSIFAVGRNFHSMIHDISVQISRAYSYPMLGKVIAVEKTVRYRDLTGRIDIIRQTKDNGYIVQDEKFKNPPSQFYVWPEDELQVNAYIYLAERNEYGERGGPPTQFKPIEAGVVMYKDLKPREINLDPLSTVKWLRQAKAVLSRKTLPPFQLSERDRRLAEESQKKCEVCLYRPLCKVLPERGAITAEQLYGFRHFAAFRARKADITAQIKQTLKIIGRCR
jgi:CRISPR/Cas system-associated exonuclease Cas4 (RecB family)